MNKFHYISPSIIPSRTANAVHVIMQCDSLANHIDTVVLYSRRSIKNKEEYNSLIKTYYNTKNDIKTISYYSKFQYGTVFIIALMSILSILINKGDIILSRNLYAAYILSKVFKFKLIYETHHLEKGFRKYLQSQILKSNLSKTIVISEKLKLILQRYHGFKINNIHVLHDSAPDSNKRFNSDEKKVYLSEQIPFCTENYEGICGYFGQLYSGRGIEIIEKLAISFPNILFLIYGGKDKDIEYRRIKNENMENLYIGGHISHFECQCLMRCVDILLMPYQEKVSIGIDGYDTGKWMSPMKLFEYMSTGVPIISSELNVLKEVLNNRRNAILAKPNNITDWINALTYLLNNKTQADKIATNAYNDFYSLYTWNIRAKKIINISEY